MLAVGIDISKSKSVAAILNQDGSMHTSPFEFHHTQPELDAFIKYILNSNQSATILMENTGHYHYPVLKAFREAGLPVCMVNAYQIKKFGDMDLRKAKTDKKDAVRIARYALEKSYSLVPYTSMEQKYEDLRFLARQYNQRMLLSNGSPISNLNEGIIYMGQGYIGPIPFSVLLMLVFIVIGHIIFSRTQFGRNVIAVGGNPEAARVSGIDVNKTRVYVSALLGFTIAIMALVSCGRIASAQTTLGGDTVMDIIAAVVIGGTPMGGGSGTVVGTLFGCLVIGLISNGLNLLKVSSYWQMVSKGVIILVAVILDVYSERIYDRMRNKD